MHFRTRIDIPPSKIGIDHQDQLMILGSCFAENIGELLEQNKFSININPFGTLYNPESVKQGLEILISDKQFTAGDIFFHKDVYHSFMHHSRFSHKDKDSCLANINSTLQQAREDLSKTKILIITFGTSYVYKLKDTNRTVANCHKIPANRFDRSILDIDTIVNEWNCLLKEIEKIAPDIHFIFTVSPIRHFKDGAHQNQLSKAILLLAVDRFCKMHQNAAYFPSYEIVLDELRDYRFYGEDMVHPNNVAVRYIWERFADTHFSQKTKQIINEWEKLQSAIQHRPFNPDTEEHKLFLEQTLLRIKEFGNKYPYICSCKEVDNLLHRIG